MNICFLTTDMVNPKCGGIERVTDALAREFAKDGDVVCFCSMYRHKEDVFDAEKQYFFPGKDVYGKENAAFWKDFLRSKKIDLVIYQGGGLKKVPFPSITKKMGVRLLVAFHSKPDYFRRSVPLLLAQKYAFSLNKPMPMRIRFKAFFRIRSFVSLYRFNAKYADRIILLSKNYKKELLDIVGAHYENKIFAIPNPCPVEIKFREDELKNKKATLLFVGRMSFDDKRPDRLLSIWTKLESRFPKWHLKFIGDGDYLPTLKSLAETLGTERVSFEGFQDPVPFYRDASILCMTSTYEGFPMVLVEAANFACVPVAFDSFAAAHDIIDDGENGFIVPAFDLDAYAEKLAQLMCDDSLRERLAKNALIQIPEKFSRQKIAAEWKSLAE